MSRNVVVSEGHSDVLDDKKYGAIWFFAADLGGGGLYSSGGYTRAFTVPNLTHRGGQFGKLLYVSKIQNRKTLKTAMMFQHSISGKIMVSSCHTRRRVDISEHICFNHTGNHNEKCINSQTVISEFPGQLPLLSINSNNLKYKNQRFLQSVLVWLL